jgi:hypothetical protein
VVHPRNQHANSTKIPNDSRKSWFAARCAKVCLTVTGFQALRVSRSVPPRQPFHVRVPTWGPQVDAWQRATFPPEVVSGVRSQAGRRQCHRSDSSKLKQLVRYESSAHLSRRCVMTSTSVQPPPIVSNNFTPRYPSWSFRNNRYHAWARSRRSVCCMKGWDSLHPRATFDIV